MIFTLLACFATAALASFLGAARSKLLRHDGSKRNTIERKVAVLTTSLGDTVKSISQIEIVISVASIVHLRSGSNSISLLAASRIGSDINSRNLCAFI